MIDREVDLPKKDATFLPWDGRETEEWEKTVSRTEAFRLFFLAHKEHPKQFPDNDLSWIARFSLEVPFALYWEENPKLLLKDIRSTEEKSSSASQRHINTETINLLMPPVCKIFTDLSLCNFLRTIRQIDRERHKSQANSLSPAQVNLMVAAGQKLNWSDSAVSTAQQAYQTLAELFLPQASRYARARQTQQFRQDSDDLEAMAHLQTTLQVTQFYWESIAINPQWTLNRFLSSLSASLYDPSFNSFDSKRLEVRGEVTFQKTPHSGNITETPAFDKIAEQEELTQVCKMLSSTQRVVFEQRVVQERTYSDIARELQVPLWKIKDIAKVLRRKFRALLKVKKPDNKGQTINNSTEKPPLKGLLADHQRYRSLFEKHKMELRPLHRAIFDAVLTVQTSEKDSTLKALQEHFPSEKVTTLERQIRRITALLNGNERIILSKQVTPGARYRESQMARQVAQNQEDYWQAFTPIQQKIIIEFYLTDPNLSISQKEVARQLGINSATVSRNLELIRMRFITLFCPQY